jgi:hypothetical protein
MDIVSRYFDDVSLYLLTERHLFSFEQHNIAFESVQSFFQ